MHFHVGQMVVCVDDSLETYRHLDPHGGAGKGWPVKGRIYTVRGLGIAMGIPGLHLEEIVREWECPFAASRFRPVKETSIEIFRKLVAPIDGERVDV